LSLPFIDYLLMLVRFERFSNLRNMASVVNSAVRERRRQLMQ